jgi:hypothetical protein
MKLFQGLMNFLKEQNYNVIFFYLFSTTETYSNLLEIVCQNKTSYKHVILNPTIVKEGESHEYRVMVSEIIRNIHYSYSKYINYFGMEVFSISKNVYKSVFFEDDKKYWEILDRIITVEIDIRKINSNELIEGLLNKTLNSPGQYLHSNERYINNRCPDPNWNYFIVLIGILNVLIFFLFFVFSFLN